MNHQDLSPRHTDYTGSHANQLSRHTEHLDGYQTRLRLAFASDDGVTLDSASIMGFRLQGEVRRWVSTFGR
ncbi:unnamed protein product [Lampetra planeri]